MKHISKPITFLLHELAGSIKSHFVARVLLHLSFIETDFQPCVLLKKNLLYKSSQDFWLTPYERERELYTPSFCFVFL